MQKLNNDQLRQLYFESSTPSKSFRKRKDHIKTNGSRQSFFDTHTNYKRFSESEINRFEKFFNTHVYPASQNYIFKEPKITQKSPKFHEDKDFSLVKTCHEPDLQFDPQEENTNAEVELSQISQLKKDFPKQVKIDDEAQNESGKDNEDLIFLETLMSRETNEITTPISNSLSDIFAEIIDNEKKSISNYESSVFDANIQMLFDEAPDIPLQPTSSNEIEAPKIVNEPPSIPVAPKAVTLLPPAPITSKTVDELPPTSVTEDTSDEVPPEFVVAPVEDFAPDKQKWKKKRKRSKLRLLNIILILIILAVLSVLIYHFRHLLPFDLPF